MSDEQTDEQTDQQTSTAAPAPNTGEAATVAALQAQLAEARETVESMKDQALRAHAEVENMRRRAQRDVESAHKFALERFAADLLPVVDSLERAVEAAEAADAERNVTAIAEGVELSRKLFVDTLAKSGIEAVDPLGAPFDPQFHQAMSMVASADAEPGSVVKVLQRGYTLNGRLVRPAMVMVAKAAAPGVDEEA
jgi:molecular chaperone GrpE